MSVIVKGMEMPKGSCEWVDAEIHLHRCKFLDGDDDCKVQEGVCADATWEEQFAGCPLIEIPTPHGRLIDADEIEMPYLETTADQKRMEIAIKLTPTVIEAEGSEE